MKYSHGSKSVRHLFEIYTDFETLLEITAGCENNPKKLFTTAVNRRIP